MAVQEPKERNRSQQDIVNMMSKNLPRYNEIKAFAIQEQTISVNRRGGLPVQFVLQNNDFEKIKAVLPKFMEAAGKSSVFAGVDADLKFNKPELRISIDRLRASGVRILQTNHWGWFTGILQRKRYHLGFFKGALAARASCHTSAKMVPRPVPGRARCFLMPTRSDD
jgi:hypothetical protein